MGKNYFQKLRMTRTNHEDILTNKCVVRTVSRHARIGIDESI